MHLLPIDFFYYYVVIHVMQFFAFIDTIDIRPVLVNIRRVKAVQSSMLLYLKELECRIVIWQ